MKYKNKTNKFGTYTWMMDKNSSINPTMHNWNKVYIKSCDGNSMLGANSSLTYYAGLYHFWRGATIRDEIMADLKKNRGLNSKVKEVVIAGNDYGGVAAL